MKTFFGTSSVEQILLAGASLPVGTQSLVHAVLADHGVARVVVVGAISPRRCVDEDRGVESAPVDEAVAFVAKQVKALVLLIEERTLDGPGRQLQITVCRRGLRLLDLARLGGLSPLTATFWDEAIAATVASSSALAATIASSSALVATLLKMLGRSDRRDLRVLCLLVAHENPQEQLKCHAWSAVLSWAGPEGL